MPPSQKQPNTKIEKIGRVSSASVKKHTGKSWDQWIKILNKANAENWPHRELALLLKQKYKLSQWWQQSVAIGYEMFLGKRVEGRNEKGEYSLTVTKALPLRQKKAWRLLSSAEGIAIWLRPFGKFALQPKAEFEVYGGIFGEVRTMKAPLRIRLAWQDSKWERASIVQVQLVPRKGEKSVLVIQHEKLPTDQWREKMRAHWKQTATALVETIVKKTPGSAHE